MGRVHQPLGIDRADDVPVRARGLHAFDQRHDEAFFVGEFCGPLSVRAIVVVVGNGDAGRGLSIQCGVQSERELKAASG